MSDLEREAALADTIALLKRYNFDLGDRAPEQLLHKWLPNAAPSWIRLATIEALYQGRYKAISIEQILANWQRRSQPVYHFNSDFERLVCGEIAATETTEPETEPVAEDAEPEADEPAIEPEDTLEARSEFYTKLKAFIEGETDETTDQ